MVGMDPTINRMELNMLDLVLILAAAFILGWALGNLQLWWIETR